MTRACCLLRSLLHVAGAAGEVSVSWLGLVVCWGLLSMSQMLLVKCEQVRFSPVSISVGPNVHAALGAGIPTSREAVKYTKFFA